MPRTPRVPLDLHRAMRLYESGMTLRQVAAKVGWSYGGLHHRFVQAGVTLRPRGGCVSATRLVRNRLSESQVADIVQRAKNGESVTEMARQVNVSPTSLYRLLTEEGVHEPRPRRKLTHEQVRSAVARVRAGESMSTVAFDFGVTAHALRYHVFRVNRP